MAKVKFPLEMANGVQVRTIEELKENFDANKVVGYFLDGKLITWLKDRYYDEEVEQLSQLNPNDNELVKKIYEIFQLEYSEQVNLDINKITSDNKKIELIKQVTDDEDIILNYTCVAVNQSELENLYEKGVKIIYLLGNEFKVNHNVSCTYIGLNTPTVMIGDDEEIDFDGKGVIFEGVSLRSTNKTVLKIRRSKNISVGDNIITKLVPKECIFAKEVSDDTNNLNCITVDDYAIIWKQNSRYIEVVDIITGKVKLRYEDVKPTAVKGYKSQTIKCVAVEKNTMVILWGECENSAIQTISLESFKPEKTININTYHGSYSPSEDYISIHDDIITTYAGLGLKGYHKSHEVIVARYNAKTLEAIDSSILNEKIEHVDYSPYGCEFNGHAYRFMGTKKYIVSTDEKHKVIKLFNDNEATSANGDCGTVGIFKVYDDKIYAISMTEYGCDRKTRDSIPDEGEICVFDMESGMLIDKFDSTYNKVEDLIVTDDFVFVWKKHGNTVKVFDKITKNLEREIELEGDVKWIDNVSYDDGTLSISAYKNVFIYR